jgi:hypothetical protein
LLLPCFFGMGMETEKSYVAPLKEGMAKDIRYLVALIHLQVTFFVFAPISMLVFGQNPRLIQNQ